MCVCVCVCVCLMVCMYMNVRCVCIIFLYAAMHQLFPSRMKDLACENLRTPVGTMTRKVTCFWFELLK